MREKERRERGGEERRVKSKRGRVREGERERGEGGEERRERAIMPVLEEILTYNMYIVMATPLRYMHHACAYNTVPGLYRSM